VIILTIRKVTVELPSTARGPILTPIPVRRIAIILLNYVFQSVTQILIFMNFTILKVKSCQPRREVTLIPDQAEDMWHAYNLIAAGDNVRSTTIRLI
jgi:hypothetical protein